MFSYGRRAIDLAVLFLALYAFAFVPLGRHTGLEHVLSILKTPPARDAAHEILEAADKLRKKLIGSVLETDAPIRTPGVPAIPKLPRRDPPPNLAPAPLILDAPDASL